jgi:hypothetical protein
MWRCANEKREVQSARELPSGSTSTRFGAAKRARPRRTFPSCHRDGVLGMAFCVDHRCAFCASRPVASLAYPSIDATLPPRPHTFLMLDRRIKSATARQSEEDIMQYDGIASPDRDAQS